MSAERIAELEARLETCAAERDDARELYREVVRHLTSEIARLTKVEDAARALLDSDISLCDHVTDSREWDRQMDLLRALRESLSPPSPPSVEGADKIERCDHGYPIAYWCQKCRPPPEAARCGECPWCERVEGHDQDCPYEGSFEPEDCGSGRSGGSR